MNFPNLVVAGFLLIFFNFSHAIDCASIAKHSKSADKRYQATIRDAINCGQPESVRWLAANGMSVNASDDAGNTPLMFAIVQHHPEMVQALLDAKADVHARQKWTGKTARQLAADAAKYNPIYEPVVHLLESFGSTEYIGDKLPPSNFDAELEGKDQFDVTGDIYSRLPFVGPSYRFFAVSRTAKKDILPSPSIPGSSFSRSSVLLFAVLPNYQVVKIKEVSDFLKLRIWLRSETDALQLVRAFTDLNLNGPMFVHFADIDLAELPTELPSYTCIFVTKDPLKKVGVTKPMVQTVHNADQRTSFLVTRYMIPSSVDIGVGGHYEADSVTRVAEHVGSDGSYTVAKEIVSTPGLQIKNECHTL